MKIHPNWYIAYTYPKAEKRVQNQVQDLGVETFLPLQKVKRQWSDRVKLIEEPLFSSYIFIKTTENNIPRLTDLDGIARFISFEKKFARIREEEIELIRSAVDKGKKVSVEHENFEHGEWVMVKEGPFAGLEGILIRRNGKHRFIVELEGLSKKVSIEIPTSLLMKRY